MSSPSKGKRGCNVIMNTGRGVDFSVERILLPLLKKGKNILIELVIC